MAFVQVTNLKLGPCQVFWNNVDFGFHKGATVEYRETYEEVTAEDHGEILYDRILKAKECIVTVVYQEVVKDLLAETITNSLHQTAPVDKLFVGADPGVKQRDKAKLLRLHPIAEGGFANDVYLYLALPEGPHLWVYNNEDRTITVRYKAFQHPSFSPYLFGIGGTNQWS